MIDRAAIIAAFEACEEAARKRKGRAAPASMVMMDETRACAEHAAKVTGGTYEEARAALTEHWATRPN